MIRATSASAGPHRASPPLHAALAATVAAAAASRALTGTR
jgi:hypothetical protein